MSNTPVMVIDDPCFGKLSWEVPEPLASVVSDLDEENQRIALDWLERQTEGFVLALLNTQGSERKLRNFEEKIKDLVVESLLSD